MPDHLLKALRAFAFLAVVSGAAAASDAPDTQGTGLFPAFKEEVSSLPDHVVYRPRDVARLGSQKLGIYLFGNGGCSTDGARVRMHMLEIASHGYLAIAPGRIYSGPGALPQPTRPPRPASAPLSAETSSRALIDALDWVLKENLRPGSPLYDRVNPEWVAVSGWSCGGLQAMEVSGDPRIKTVVMMNSGIFPDGTMPIEGLAVDKSQLGRLHSSILYILGGEKDIAYPNGMDDFRRINRVPTEVVNIPVGHGGTFDEANGGLGAKIAIAWLDWQLKGDANAAAQFKGVNCALCSAPGITLERKKID